ncbi:MAG: TonB family protein / TonB-dependent receptor [Labilithrix sp.]|nr:TonB family protein / TonB-dependent receptor [Labilithrix sp.]
MKSIHLVRLGRAAAVCALLTGGSIAHAEPALSPPRLSRFVDAVDPRPEGPAERASVELELDIDKSGTVTDARVLRSASDVLDAAAVAAAKSFVFDPAMRDGTPVPARIRYEYVFAARAPEPPPPVAAPAVRPASVAGVVRDRDTGKPIANADVLVTTDAGGAYRAKTDENGAFRIDGVEPGPAHVVASASDHVPMRLDETLDPGTLTEATLRLEAPPDPEAFVATARVEAPPREVTKRSLDRAELTSVAGTRGDPLRAVELMPGVSRPSFGGNPILRGANPFDTQVFLEGAPVPILYHFGGLTSFVHSRVLDTVDMYPSNFSARYGRKIGGVIEAKIRDPRTDGFHGIAEASLLDSSLLVETPIGEKFSVLAAARRSNLDAVINSAQNSVDLGITAAPVYWDYQAVAAYKPTDQDRIRLMAYGSSDSFKVVFKNPEAADPAIRGAFGGSTVFHRVQLGYRHRFRGGSEQNTELTYGRMDDKGEFGQIGRSTFAIDTVQGRTEWTSVVSPAVRLTAGLDLLGNHFSGNYSGVAVPPDEGQNPTAISTQRQIEISASTWVLLPGAYVEAGLRPVSSLLISPGVRADYNDLVKRGAIDPRLSARWDVTERTAIKAGVGRFSQSPDERMAVNPIGNPDLKMTQALHVSAGVEQKITDAFTASVEGFSKWIDNGVTSTPDGRAPFFVNSQDGRVFGGELMLRVKPTGRFFGFVSYTLMRSERRDSEDQPWRLFDRDQTHILGASGAYRLGRGWEIGATVRYTSGTPYTPVVASTYDATVDVYSPRIGRPMSARNPAFSRVDLRIQKTWTFSKWSLAAYLDVQNALNAPNREGFSYSYDYRERTGARGLPILPILGLRGEL